MFVIYRHYIHIFVILKRTILKTIWVLNSFQMVSYKAIFGYPRNVFLRLSPPWPYRNHLRNLKCFQNCLSGETFSLDGTYCNMKNLVCITFNPFDLVCIGDVLGDWIWILKLLLDMKIETIHIIWVKKYVHHFFRANSK